MQKIDYFSDMGSSAKELGEKVIAYIREGQIETYESFDGYTLAAFDWYSFEEDAGGKEVVPSQILIYIDREKLYYLCESGQAYEAAARCMEEAPSSEQAMYGFFRNLLRGGVRNLERLDEEVSELEDDVNDGTEDGLSERIDTLRNRIRRANSYYEQMEFLLSEFCDNRNELLSPPALRSLENIRNRAVRMCSMSRHLRDYIMQVRETYQAQIGIEQNHMMKVFTMVTSIFLPLTLIAGWYGMNLKMPEFTWDYGYPFVAALSVTVCVIWLYVFRRKGWIQ